MEISIRGKASGAWIPEPAETSLPFTQSSWQHFQASSPIGVIEYVLRTMNGIDAQVFRLKLNTQDQLNIKIKPDATPHLFTLIFQLIGSSLFIRPKNPPHSFFERSGNLLFHPGNSLHFELPNPESSLLMLIHFTNEFIISSEEQIIPTDNLNSGFLKLKNLILDQHLLNSLSAILFGNYQDEWESYIFEEEVRNIALTLIRKKNKGPFQPMRIRETEISWFHIKKNQLLSVKNKTLPFQSLLKEAGINDIRRFRKLLQSFYALSIRDFLTEARIADAQILLRTTDLPIKQIAAQTGYKNIFYFTRIFKTYTGLPPARFQKINEQ